MSTARSLVLVTCTAALVAAACDTAPTDPDVRPSFGAAHGAQHITDCYVITEPGTYVLAGDLVVDGRAACVDPDEFDPSFFNLVGIRIEANDVKLSLAGSTIRGDGSSVASCPADPGGGDPLPCGIGIRFASDVQNVHITGGTIDGGGLFFDGIQTSGNSHVKVNGVTISGNTRFGLGSVFCSECDYSGNTFSWNGNAGIQTVFAGRADLGIGPTRISGNRFLNNGLGITLGFFSGNVTIVGNEFSGSQGDGITEFLAPRGGNTIQGNTVSNNGGNGVFLFSSNNTVRGNQVLGSGRDGIVVLKGGFFPGGEPTTGNVVQANRVVGSSGVDLVDANDECGNTWKSNTFQTDSEGDGPKKGCIQ